MPDVRHMDPSLNLVVRRDVAADSGKLLLEFCRAVGHKQVMQRLEDAFTYHLSCYVVSALQSNTRTAQTSREEVCRLIRRARELTFRSAAKTSLTYQSAAKTPR